ncbi:MAG: hypothetical protein GYA55_10700 [SAR324 cluster bacterium]|uniref:Phospholipase/carboxylesterase/thioesterase domain-containing protein n=1 Tax=SAR324 cluster bacterium TaxID=2024889 RepID=A0A7X9FSU6_9DELT|nr:hypothetical protein [SAR324 cluster bacterium]
MLLSKEIYQDLSLRYSLRLSTDVQTPVVFLLHGRGGTAHSMGIFLKAVPPDYSVISPEGRFTDPELGGKSWWKPGESTPFDKMERAREVVAFFIEATKRHKLHPSHTIAIGFSQGAGLLSLAASLDTCPLSGIAFLSGYQERGDKGEIPALKRKCRFFIYHGSKDKILPAEAMRSLASDLKDNGFEIVYEEEELGHKVGTKTMHKLSEWLKSF